VCVQSYWQSAGTFFISNRERVKSVFLVFFKSLLSEKLKINSQKESEVCEHLEITKSPELTPADEEFKKNKRHSV
jgi:hypothetical protein